MYPLTSSWLVLACILSKMPSDASLSIARLMEWCVHVPLASMLVSAQSRGAISDSPVVGSLCLVQTA